MTTVADGVRPSRLPRGERRAMLLASAREAFVSMGYHGAGMDAIADLARVSKPVLYQHFPGKLELYLAVLDESTESLVAAVRSALDSTTDNARRVQATIEAYFAFVADDSAAFKLIFESDLTNEPEVGRRVNRANEKCAEMISAVIAQDTDLGQEEAMILATGLTGLAQTAARHWLATGSLITQKAAARDLYQLAWRGISGFPLTHPAKSAADSGNQTNKAGFARDQGKVSTGSGRSLEEDQTSARQPSLSRSVTPANHSSTNQSSANQSSAKKAAAGSGTAGTIPDHTIPDHTNTDHTNTDHTNTDHTNTANTTPKEHPNGGSDRRPRRAPGTRA